MTEEGFFVAGQLACVGGLPLEPIVVGQQARIALSLSDRFVYGPGESLESYLAKSRPAFFSLLGVKSDKDMAKKLSYCSVAMRANKLHVDFSVPNRALGGFDYTGEQISMPLNAADEDLGEAILKALGADMPSS